VTTIVTLGDSEGERRCTAACHEATGQNCACVCGGRFHGAARRSGGVEAVQREAAKRLVEHREEFGPLFAYRKNGGIP
jgi:hypothetical protein